MNLNKSNSCTSPFLPSPFTLPAGSTYDRLPLLPNELIIIYTYRTSELSCSRRTSSPSLGEKRGDHVLLLARAVVGSHHTNSKKTRSSSRAALIGHHQNPRHAGSTATYSSGRAARRSSGNAPRCARAAVPLGRRPDRGR
jgi:hypothetical protein